jgi:hypothetical protein
LGCLIVFCLFWGQYYSITLILQAEFNLLAIIQSFSFALTSDHKLSHHLMINLSHHHSLLRINHNILSLVCRCLRQIFNIFIVYFLLWYFIILVAKVIVMLFGISFMWILVIYLMFLLVTIGGLMFVRIICSFYYYYHSFMRIIDFLSFPPLLLTHQSLQ